MIKATIECDRCPEVGASYMGHDPMGVLAAKRDLIGAGWSFRKEQTLCPECLRGFLASEFG